MNFFRFCRQGLTALPVFFMLMACDKLLPTGGSGDLVQVRIRSVSVSGALTFLPKATEDYTLSLAGGAVTLSDSKSSQISSATLPNSTFEAGKSYTIQITKPPRFAGSNIYWDNSDQDVSKHKLTFDEHGITTHQDYQGVYFKWGSLIGISPVRTDGSNDFSSGTTDNYGLNNGTPIYLKVGDKWKKTNVAYATQQKWFGSGSAVENKTDDEAWSPIPSYYDVSITSPVGNDAHSLLANPDFEHYKGDICNYINPAYRMPTGNELDAIIPDPYNGFSQVTNDIPGATDNDKAGKYTFTDNFVTLKEDHIFPASGYRDDSSGALNGVGRNGYYWSGSAVSGANDAYFLDFYYSSGGASTYDTYRSYGWPIRCVLN